MPSEIEWRTVPAGPFLMGSDPGGAYPPDSDEQPLRFLSLAPFELSRTPVTNAQYRAFAHATGRPPPLSPGKTSCRSPTSRGTTRRPSATGPARGFRPRRSGKPPRGAVTSGSGRGATSRPTRLAAPSPPESAAPRRWGAVRWGPRAPRVRSTWPETCGSGSRAPTGLIPTIPTMGANRRGPASAWYAAARTWTGQTQMRCSTRRPMLAAARDTYVGFRVVRAAAGQRLELDWVNVPAGEVVLGRDAVPFTGEAPADELPRHVVDLPSFELSLTPVTNAQYERFVATGAVAPPALWLDGTTPTGLEAHPVTLVDWFDARSFCCLVEGRLPTEAEWEKGARGADARSTRGATGRSESPLARGFWDQARRRPVVRERPAVQVPTCPSTWPGTSGNGSAPHTSPIHSLRGRAGRSRGGAARVLRGGSFASLRSAWSAARRAAGAARGGAASHRLPGRPGPSPLALGAQTHAWMRSSRAVLSAISRSTSPRSTFVFVIP